LVKDVNPWDYPSNEVVLKKLGIPYDVVNSANFGKVDLSKYKVVIIASDQSQTFYNRMAGYISKLENYVKNG